MIRMRWLDGITDSMDMSVSKLQYSGLKNSMDRGARQATVHGVTKSWTRLSDFHFHFTFFLAPISLPLTPHIQLYLINIPGPLPVGSQT